MIVSWGHCATCHGYDYLDRHRCKPEWHAWDPEHHEVGDPDDGCTVRADDAEEAAEEFAELVDTDGDVIRQGGIDVVVVAPVADPTQQTRMTVAAEARVHYSARPAPAKDLTP